MKDLIPFLFFVFILLPAIKAIFGRKKTNKKFPVKKPSRQNTPANEDWRDVYKQARQQYEKKQTEKNSPYPAKKNHAQRLKSRDKRSLDQKLELTAALANKKDSAVIRDSNQGIEEWGRKGENAGLGKLLFFIIIAGIIFALINNFAPDLLR